MHGDDYKTHIRLWHVGDDSAFTASLNENGLNIVVNAREITSTAERDIAALRAHPLFNKLDSAREARHHEVRYDLPNERGIMDLLYHTEAGWFIIDFKTDVVRSDVEARSAISQNGYDRQVERYARAIGDQLKVQAKTRLVFLNVNGEEKSTSNYPMDLKVFITSQDLTCDECGEKLRHHISRFPSDKLCEQKRSLAVRSKLYLPPAFFWKRINGTHLHDGRLGGKKFRSRAGSLPTLQRTRHIPRPEFHRSVNSN